LGFRVQVGSWGFYEAWLGWSHGKAVGFLFLGSVLWFLLGDGVEDVFGEFFVDGAGESRQHGGLD
jgi:hypothetical protein